MTNDIIKYLNSHHTPYEINVNLSKKTWIHRGGNAELYILPSTSEQLADICSYLYSINCEFLLVGHTSNLYILNTTHIKVVVSTIKCNKYEIINGNIVCEAGVGVMKMSKAMIELGIAGFEYLTGLPGTIGAALYNNSSCKDNSISKLLISADVLTTDGKVVTMYPEEFEFNFRSSVFKEKKRNGIIISAVLKVEYADSAELKAIAIENSRERNEILEGHAKNLGCTVNNCWSLGSMPLKYKLQQRLLSILLKIKGMEEIERRKILKRQLFRCSGYEDVEPYVSDKNPIIFMWLDEGADMQFENYLSFMEKVYRTRSLEIEIIQ